MLLPRELDMIAAGRNMPLPVPKPNFPKVEVTRHAGKANAELATSVTNAPVTAKSRRQLVQQKPAAFGSGISSYR
jgi:hypothetical protein